MRAPFHKSLLLITLAGVFAIPANLSAQTQRFPDVFLSDVRTTEAGQPVAVRIADPFARPDQERALLKFLRQPYSFDWDSRTTVADIQRDIGKHIALQIDRRSMEEIGLTDDVALFPGNPAKVRNERRREALNDDPFGNHSPNQESTANKESESRLTETRATEKAETHWWKKTRSGPPASQLTNAAKLFFGLRTADLVIATWSGQWLVTTEEAAEQRLSNRLYDVTPFAKIQESPPSQGLGGGGGFNFAGFAPMMYSSNNALVDTVESMVDPDTWETLGGPSTCRLVVVNGRSWLAVSAPVMTHWKVQALLNKLNGS